jgi:hypothetical protein
MWNCAGRYGGHRPFHINDAGATEADKDEHDRDRQAAKIASILFMIFSFEMSADNSAPIGLFRLGSGPRRRPPLLVCS